MQSATAECLVIQQTANQGGTEWQRNTTLGSGHMLYILFVHDFFPASLLMCSAVGAPLHYLTNSWWPQNSLWPRVTHRFITGHLQVEVSIEAFSGSALLECLPVNVRLEDG